MFEFIVRDMYQRLHARLYPSKIIQSDLPSILSNCPTLFYGYSQKALQAAIDRLQAILEKEGLLSAPSGVFDRETEIAVREFQHSRRLVVDGIVGTLTWAALLYPTLSRHMSDVSSTEKVQHVRELQKRLCEDGIVVAIDGDFDRRTEKALKKFQKRYGIDPTGSCGPLTWSALVWQRTAQRQTSKRRYSLQMLAEQLSMVFFIFCGMVLNPSEEDLGLTVLEAIAIAYSLTWVVPFLVGRIASIYPEHRTISQNNTLLRYAPYALTGLFWRSIWDGLKLVIANAT